MRGAKRNRIDRHPGGIERNAPRYAHHNKKDRPGFNVDNIAHLMGELNVMGVKRADGSIGTDSVLTRSEFVPGTKKGAVVCVSCGDFP